MSSLQAEEGQRIDVGGCLGGGAGGVRADTEGCARVESNDLRTTEQVRQVIVAVRGDQGVGDTAGRQIGCGDVDVFVFDAVTEIGDVIQRSGCR